MPSTGSATVLRNLIERRQWKAAFVHLQSNPTDASAPFSSGGLQPVDLLPLHLACEAQAPPAVVRALLSANGDAAAARGQRGYLPLHYVCASEHATERVVSLLLTAEPAAAGVRAEDGMLPLHLVCKVGAPEDAIDAILAAHPEGLYVRDADGNFPIDYVKSGGRKNKASVFATLDRASKYASISKAAVTRTADEYEAKLKAAKRDHAAEVAELKRQCEGGRAKVRSLEEDIRKADVEGERERNRKLAEELAGVKAALEGERAEAKRTQEGLRSELETVQMRAMGLSGELEESHAVIRANQDAEGDLKARIEELESALEGSRVLLEEAKSARNASSDRVQELEKLLSTSNSARSEHVRQNRMLRDMLASVSGTVRLVMAEQDALRGALSERGEELRALASANDNLRDRADRQAEAMVRAKIDLDDATRVAGYGVGAEEEDDDDDDDGGAHGDDGTADTKSISSSSAEMPGSPSPPQHAVDLPPLEEKALGSLVLQELP